MPYQYLARIRHCFTHIFTDDLLQCRPEDAPREHLNILLNVPRFWIGEAHDQLEEILTARLRLRNGDRPETFEVTADTILFLDGKTNADKSFKQVDRVDRCHKALVLVLAIDARDNDAVLLEVLLVDRAEHGMDFGTLLTTPELHQTTAMLPLILIPATVS